MLGFICSSIERKSAAPPAAIRARNSITFNTKTPNDGLLQSIQWKFRVKMISFFFLHFFCEVWKLPASFCIFFSAHICYSDLPSQNKITTTNLMYCDTFVWCCGWRCHYKWTHYNSKSAQSINLSFTYILRFHKRLYPLQNSLSLWFSTNTKLSTDSSMLY